MFRLGFRCRCRSALLAAVLGLEANLLSRTQRTLRARTQNVAITFVFHRHWLFAFMKTFLDGWTFRFDAFLFGTLARV